FGVVSLRNRLLSPRKRARARARARKRPVNASCFPALAHEGCRGATPPKRGRERGTGTGTFTGVERLAAQLVGAACFSSKVARRGAAPSTCFSAIPRSFS